MSDIKFRIGADNSAFNKGLKEAEGRGKAFGTAMDDVGKKLGRTFGAGDVFKGLLQGLGIGSAEKIADLLVTPFRAAAEAAKEFLSYSERATTATLRLIGLGKTDEEKLNILKQEEATLSLQLEAYAGRLLSEKESIAAERLKAELSEKSLEVAEQQARVAEREARAREEAAAKSRAVAGAQYRYLERLWRLGIENKDIEEQIATLLDKANAARSQARMYREGELEHYEALNRALDLELEARELEIKAEEDKAKAADKAADEFERQERALEAARKESQQMAKAIISANDALQNAKKDLRDARAGEFGISLSEAAGCKRGGPNANGKARIIGQKEGQMRAILDRGGYSIAFDDAGKPTLTHSDPTKSRDAAQATGRFRALYSDRNALRGSIANLNAAEKSPFGGGVKAIEKATQDAATLLKEIRDGKFTNQGDKAAK